MHRLEIPNVIDFLSKGCKYKKHQECQGAWVGLGFQVVCNCICHHNNRIINTKSRETIERSIEYKRNRNRSVVESKSAFVIDNKLNDLKKNIEPVDKSFRGSNQQVPCAKGE